MIVNFYLYVLFVFKNILSVVTMENAHTGTSQKMISLIKF